MAITSGFCHNLFLPCAAASKPTQSQAQVTAVPQRRADKWREQCLVGAACMAAVAAIQMGGEVKDSSGGGAIAAKDMTTTTPLVAVADASKARWSDKRTCPPWHLNSLETIVPENLPRPSARPRIWGAVGGYTKNAPVVKVAVISKTSNCFSM